MAARCFGTGAAILLAAWLLTGCQHLRAVRLTGCALAPEAAAPVSANEAVTPEVGQQPSVALASGTPQIGNPAAVSVVELPQLAKAAFEQPWSDQAEQLPEVLSLSWLVTEIETRNPTLEALMAAWQAAAQRGPQQRALDDPMLMGMLAPESAGSRLTETAYALQLNQKLPWFGKRQLRGAAADAQADAAFQDAQDAHLAVRLAAELAYLDYYQAARLRDLNREHQAIMQQFRETAQAKYRTGLVTQQDVLQAELELAELARRQLELDRMFAVAAGRINVLLRRTPDAPLPPPPAALRTPQVPPESSSLWQAALQQRPDLAALAWRVEQAQIELELTYKNYFPDVDLFGRYDTFWQPSTTQGPLRGQLGVTINLPIWREKLDAAVCEAQFRLHQRRAEFDQKALEIQYEVQAAWQALIESQKAVELYARQLVPTAEQNVATVRANYEVNRQTFLDLALAQRQLVTLRQQQLEAEVLFHRRAAELRRAIGGTTDASADWPSTPAPSAPEAPVPAKPGP
jgi:cobalt-zinc-cadmium efflux system outer membrane protein